MCVGEGWRSGERAAENMAKNIDWKIGTTTQQWQGVMNPSSADPSAQRFLS